MSLSPWYVSPTPSGLYPVLPLPQEQPSLWLATSCVVLSLNRNISVPSISVPSVPCQPKHKTFGLALFCFSFIQGNRKSADVYVNQWNKSWEFKRENLVVDTATPLGEGQFGKVYKGFAKGVKGREGSVAVAVKVLKGEFWDARWQQIH